jgi:DNA helicase-2/ATP-dependent DNA helicase PcrA
MIPSDMATGSAEEIEEERRLLYVAMTRPRDELDVYFPLRYYHRGKGLSDAHVYAQLTRFLAGLGEGLFERVSSPQVREEEEGADEETPDGPPASVDQLLGDLLSD